MFSSALLENLPDLPKAMIYLPEQKQRGIPFRFLLTNRSRTLALKHIKILPKLNTNLNRTRKEHLINLRFLLDSFRLRPFQPLTEIAQFCCRLRELVEVLHYLFVLVFDVLAVVAVFV